MRSGVFHTSYAADMALARSPLARARLALFASLVVVLPFVVSSYWLSLANQIAIATVGAIGLNILVGYTGQISLGQGAFMAVGAYASGLATIVWGLPFWISIPLASLFTAMVGVFFELSSLRLKGLYLAIATLAAQQIVEWIVTHWTALPGGTEALVVPAPTLFGARINTDFGFYWVAVGAASATGVNVFRYKLTAFAVSSFFVGMAGALIAHYRTIVTWERFTLEVSILYLAMIIIGGLGSIVGSFLGAAVMTLLPALIATFGRSLQTSIPRVAELLPAAQEAVFGLVVLLVLIFEPKGLAKVWSNVKTYFRLWPFSH